MGILAVPAMMAATVSATKWFSVGDQVVAEYDDRFEVVKKHWKDYIGNDAESPTDYKFSEFDGKMLGVLVEAKPIPGNPLLRGKVKVCWCRNQDTWRRRGIESGWIEDRPWQAPLIRDAPSSPERTCTRVDYKCTGEYSKCILGPSPPCTTTTPRPPPPPVAPKASIPAPSPTASGPPSSLSPAQIGGIILIIAGTAIIGFLSAALLSWWRSGTTPRGRRARPSSRSR